MNFQVSAFVKPVWKYVGIDAALEIQPGSFHLGGVYMTPGRLSHRDEFTPVPSRGSTFVYMIPPQKVMPARVAPA